MTISLTVKGSLPALKGCSPITGSFTLGVNASGVLEVYNVDRYHLTIVNTDEKTCDHYLPDAAAHAGMRPALTTDFMERPLIFCNECAEFYSWWKYLDMGA